jgi:hypothetical protein
MSTEPSELAVQELGLPTYSDLHSRVEQLEAALRWYIAHVQDCEGTDFLSGSHCVASDEPHLTLARTFRAKQY